MSYTVKRKILTCAVLAAGLSTSPLYAETDWKGETRDAWLDGKLESSYLLNTELNNFKIDTEVKNGNVTLTGNVPTEVHQDLAIQIAKNLEGVKNVNNKLTIGDNVTAYSENERNFSTRFYDATTTAGLKSKYAVNSEIAAHEINIDTEDGVVTLNGEVDSNAAKELAEEIAESFDHVKKINNRLVVAQR